MTYERLCDLHTHSTFSDGTLTPTELIGEAARLGLSAVALTDHNTLAGIREFRAAAEGSEVIAIPGIEISTDYGPHEFHLLGLYLNEDAEEKICAVLSEMKQAKRESNRRLVAALAEAGYPLDLAAIEASTPTGEINRAHIGAALLAAGYVGSIKEAFATLLAPERGYYEPPKRPETLGMIRLLHSLGAVSVIAHPYLTMHGEELCRFLTEAKACGLDGVEVRYPLYSEEEAAEAAALAEELDLLPSGGSDFHGSRKPDIALGSGRGSLAVPFSWAEALRRRFEMYERGKSYM